MEKKFGVISVDGHCRLMHLPFDWWTTRLLRKFQPVLHPMWESVWAAAAWPHSKAMGHAPVETALGKEALHQLVFDNAVNLYKIPVRQPQEHALT